MAPEHVQEKIVLWRQCAVEFPKTRVCDPFFLGETFEETRHAVTGLFSLCHEKCAKSLKISIAIKKL